MKKVSIFLISFLLFTKCSKEEIPPSAYPRVRTTEVKNITAAGAFFKGEIIYISSDIIDHGFIWSTEPQLVLNDAAIISLGSESETGTFEAAMTGTLTKGVIYYVRSYAISSTFTVYGNRVEFGF